MSLTSMNTSSDDSQRSEKISALSYSLIKAEKECSGDYIFNDGFLKPDTAENMHDTPYNCDQTAFTGDSRHKTVPIYQPDRSATRVHLSHSSSYYDLANHGEEIIKPSNASLSSRGFKFSGAPNVPVSNGSTYKDQKGPDSKTVPEYGKNLQLGPKSHSQVNECKGDTIVRDPRNLHEAIVSSGNFKNTLDVDTPPTSASATKSYEPVLNKENNHRNKRLRTSPDCSFPRRRTSPLTHSEAATKVVNKVQGRYRQRYVVD